MPLTDLSVLAPVAGRVTTLDEVPDPVFAAGMVGPGPAIAPVAGARGGRAVVRAAAGRADPAMLDPAGGDVEGGDHLFGWRAQPGPGRRRRSGRRADAIAVAPSPGPRSP